MNEMTRLFIDYLRLGNDGAELTQWLSDLGEDAEGELDAMASYIAWLAEKRLDFIKQVDLVEAARRLKRDHHLEQANGVITRASTIKPPHGLPNSSGYETSHREKSVESRQFSFHVG